MTVRFKQISEYSKSQLDNKFTYIIVEDIIVPKNTAKAISGKELQLIELMSTIHVLVDNHTYQVFEALIVDEDRFKFNLFRKEINLRNNNV